MASNVEGLIREGIAAYKAGRKDEALKLLTKATELDEQNEEAWLWLSAVVDNVENQQICLENVVAINPKNTRALQGLEMIRKKAASRQPPAHPSPATRSSGQSPFDLNAPISGAASIDGGPLRSDPLVAPPAPGGYHGSGRQVDLPSAEEYDAWVDGLNLRGAESVPARAAPIASDPFSFENGPFQQADLDGEQFVDSGLPFDAGESDYFAPDIVSPAAEYSPAARSGPKVNPFDLPQSSSAFTDTYETVAEEPDFDSFAEITSGSFSSATPFAASSATMEDVQDESQLIRFLEYIPPEIKATHLPGQGPAYPRGLVIGLAAVGGGIVLSLLVLAGQLLAR